MAVHICGVSEYNSETGIPTVVNPDPETFYLVPGGAGNNLYIEWVYINNAWEQFGSATIDLTPYALSSSLATVATSGNYNDLSGKPNIPTKVSDLQNDSGFISSYIETDPTVPSWAKASSKPSYTASEVGALPDNTVIPSKVSDLQNDAGYLTSHQDITGKADKVSSPTTGNFAALDANGNLTDSGHKHSDYLTSHQSLSDYVQKTNYATASTAGVVKVSGIGVQIWNDGVIGTKPATSSEIKASSAQYAPITPNRQYESIFYGLAKAAGDSTQASSDNAVGTYTTDAKAAIRTMLGAVGDVQVNGTSILSNGTANVPVAGDNTYGVIRTNGEYGVYVNNNGFLQTSSASSAVVKEGTNTYRTIKPSNQHEAAFYGLAKAAGDTSQASSSNAVGTYTSAAKTAIQTMLGVETGVIYVENVSGSTPTITASANTRYICGEVTSLSFTPCGSGVCDLIFTSGSTVTLLTVPNTVKWPGWFDPTSLSLNTTYEINVLDGTYGVVAVWGV